MLSIIFPTFYPTSKFVHRRCTAKSALTARSFATSVARDHADFVVKPIDNPNIMCHAQYHQLMDCYIDRADVRSAQNLVADMNQNGPAPTMVTFTKMLASYSKDPIRLQYKLDQMRLSGIALTGGSIGALLNAFAGSGSIQRVEKSFYEFIEMGFITGNLIQLQDYSQKVTALSCYRS